MGLSLVFVNERNDRFWVDHCWTGMQEARRVGSVDRNVGVMREVKLGMPSCEEVYLFWVVKARKCVLVTMGRGSEKAKPVELVVDLEVPIRIRLERIGDRRWAQAANGQDELMRGR